MTTARQKTPSPSCRSGSRSRQRHFASRGWSAGSIHLHDVREKTLSASQLGQNDDSPEKIEALRLLAENLARHEPSFQYCDEFDRAGAEILILAPLPENTEPMESLNRQARALQKTR